MKSELFITGSEGFVGQHLTEGARREGYIVSGTSLAEPEGGREENIFQCDIRHAERLSKIIRDTKPEYIVHLAAYVSPSGSIKNPELTYDINVNGTRNLFEAVRLAMAADAGYRPRIVIVGSTEEFGILPDGTVVDENTPTKPVNPYGETKLAGYQLMVEYIADHGLDIVSAISSNHTGPGQDQFFAAEVAKQIVEIEKRDQEPILVTGEIFNKKNYSDVRDIARAYRLLFKLGKTGERYIVCNNQNIPLSYIVEVLLGYSTVKIGHRIEKGGGRANQTEIHFDNSKLKELTGYEPEFEIEQTLYDLLESHRAKEVR